MNQAVIMAGGEGSRLRPLTTNIPKPMLPIANRPLMEHIIHLVRRHGFTDVVATVQFLSSVIRNYFGDGSDLGVSLSYANEESPLGTAGSVLSARDLLSGPFLVISGDALTDLDLEEVVAFHRSKGAAATLVLKRMEDPLEFGIVMTDPSGRIDRFLEKPSWGQVFSDAINTGIYVLEPEVLDLIPPEQPYDFSSELFPAMLDKGLPLYGFVTDSYWTDVGSSDAYLQAQRDVLAGKVDIRPPGFELEPSVWVGEDVHIDGAARVEGPALLGDNVRVEAGATVGPFTVVGANALIGSDARVTGGVVMDAVSVGRTVLVRGAVIGRGSVLDRGATVEEGAVLGDEVTVGADAIIKPRVKIYGSRSVEAGAIVTQSVVAERRATRSLFGARGISGRINLGVTPIVAVRIGMAYGTTLRRGSVVVTGRDASRAARTMKRALIAGLNSTGVTCRDLELTPTPLTRYTVRSQQVAGGVGVRTAPGDPSTVEIRLFDGNGVDLPASEQRRVERIFFREDYRRAAPANLGDVEFPPHAPEQYVTGITRELDLSAIRAAGVKAVVDYVYGPYSLLAPAILGRLGVDALGVRAYTDESRPVVTEEDLERMLRELSEHVVKSGSDVGVLLDPGGEVAHLVDDRGQVVSPDRALLAFLRHEAMRGAEAVAVPVSAPRACADIAADAGATLQWTGTALPALMAAASDSEVAFAGNADGVLLFSCLMPAPDALMTFCKTIELVAAAGRPLSEVLADLPATHVVRKTVRTPWARKGAVMRRLASEASGELVLIDGVKAVEDGRWALVIPHPDEPLCRVWAEGRDLADSERHAQRFVGLVEEAVARTVDHEVPM